MRKPCCEKEGINKGAWSKQEDQKLIDYIEKHGEGCWSSLPSSAGLQRCGKSCRLRWINYLRPDIKRGDFARDEEDLIIKLHALLGNRWSLIAGRLPGRTDNEVKNYWNSHLKKKLIRMGIDPNKHKPQHHFPPTSSTSNQLQLSDHHRDHHPHAAAAAGGATTTITTSSSDDRSLLNVVVDQSVSCHTSSEQPLDLNLELTIAIPSSPTHGGERNGTEVGPQVQQTAAKKATLDAPTNYHVDAAAARRLSPTLLLFN